MTTGIERLITHEAYLALRQNVFDLRTYRAFKKQHHHRLMQKKALYFVGGRELVDPIHFDQVVLDVGHAQAKGAL